MDFPRQAKSWVLWLFPNVKSVDRVFAPTEYRLACFRGCSLFFTAGDFTEALPRSLPKEKRQRDGCRFPRFTCRLPQPDLALRRRSAAIPARPTPNTERVSGS